MGLGFGSACPCGGGRYHHCCGPFHRGEQRPATPEQLMRSRYSAFAVGLAAYLEATHPGGGPVTIDPQLHWLGLKVVHSSATTPTDVEGTVSFIARYRAGGRDGQLREHSLFQRRGGRRDGDWLYIRALDAPA